MSLPSEPELELELQLLPAWARQAPDENRYARYEGHEESRPARGRGPGGERRAERGPRRDRPPSGGDRGPRRERGLRGDRRGGTRPVDSRPPDHEADRRGRDHGSRRLEPRAQAPLPEVKLEILPEEKGVESLARQIRLTGRAYPLFDIAALVLKKPERYQLQFSVVKGADGSVAQPLFVCNLDETLWLSEAEAVAHVLSRHFSTFYQTERTPTDPPKGTYTFVAQCGFTGTIFGPPNLQSSQEKMRKLHAGRFSRMPFEAYKARVKIVRDEEMVKKWIEEQSWKTEFVCLNVPEPLRLASREEVEKHFREIHLPNIIKPVETHTMSGTAALQLPHGPLKLLVRQAVEDQRRFPMAVANVLSRLFANHGLQFFKVNKKVTHVSVARPHYLDLETTPVSTDVRRIVEFIHAHPGCTRRQLLDALAPGPAPAPVPAASAGETAPAGGGTGAAAPSAPAAVPPPATPEQTAIIADLHWLIHQGHVIEFHNGKLETAKKPLPKPEKKPAGAAPEGATAPAPATAAEMPAAAAEMPAAAAEMPAAAAEMPAAAAEMPAAAEAPSSSQPAEGAATEVAPPEPSPGAGQP
jgi:hypothetical protein